MTASVRPGLKRANELPERQIAPLLAGTSGADRPQENSRVDHYFANLDAMTPTQQKDYLSKQTLGDLLNIMAPMTQAERDEFVARTQERAQLSSFGLSQREVDQIKKANELTQKQTEPLLQREARTLSGGQASTPWGTISRETSRGTTDAKEYARKGIFPRTGDGNGTTRENHLASVMTEKKKDLWQKV